MASNANTISEVSERHENRNGVVATEKFEDDIIVSAFNLQPMFEEMIEESDVTGEEKVEKMESPCRKWIIRVTWTLVILIYCVYCGFAFVLNFDRSIPLLVFNSIAIAYNAYIAATNILDTKKITDLLKSRLYKLERLLTGRIWKLSLYTIAIAGMLLYVILSNVSHIENLISLAGLAFFILISWVMSYNRTKINWRPVIWGLLLQLLLGLLILRTNSGRTSFMFLGNQVEKFLDHILAGVTFVFGDHYVDFEFAFKLMPIVIFLSSVFSVLYHIGVMQIFVKFIARIIHITMKTTAAETMCTAACIFLGQPEASLLIRPYLEMMTKSELFAIMTAGFASVSGDVFAIFIKFGISSSHLLAACLMSAPAGLAVSKIICPETEESKTETWEQIKEIENIRPRTENIVEAAAKGAQDAVILVIFIGATIIAFLAILDFLNAVLVYLGSLINIENLTIDVVISYPLMPMAFLMGVSWSDCQKVGEVIGLKTIVNELIGYQRLGKYIAARQISKRSEVIATYALCGFSNPITIGVMLGGFGALIPGKKPLLAKIILRAWIAGSIACFMTACFAGLFFDESDYEPVTNRTFVNQTVIK